MYSIEVSHKHVLYCRQMSIQWANELVSIAMCTVQGNPCLVTQDDKLAKGCRLPVHDAHTEITIAANHSHPDDST